MLHCIEIHNYNAQLKVFKKVLKECRKHKVCPSCGSEQLGEAKKLAKGDAGKIVLEHLDLNALDVWRRFIRIPKKHQFLFCINPEKNDLADLITTIVPAPPNSLRPSTTRANSATSDEDDLTMKLKSILYQNSLLAKQIEDGRDGLSVLKTQFLMQSHYFHYFNSETPRLPQLGKGGKMDIRGIY